MPQRVPHWFPIAKAFEITKQANEAEEDSSRHKAEHPKHLIATKACRHKNIVLKPNHPTVQMALKG